MILISPRVFRFHQGSCALCEKILTNMGGPFIWTIGYHIICIIGYHKIQNLKSEFRFLCCQEQLLFLCDATAITTVRFFIPLHMEHTIFPYDMNHIIYSYIYLLKVLSRILLLSRNCLL